MAEYIEREVLLKFADTVEAQYGNNRVLTIENLKYLAGELPAADVVPVVHGRWKLLANGNGVCSACNLITVHVWDFDSSLSYCPHCGARMD